MKRILISLVMWGALLILGGCSAIAPAREFPLGELEGVQNGFYVYDSSEGECHSLYMPERDASNSGLEAKTLEGVTAPFLINVGDLDLIPVIGKGDLVLLRAGQEPEREIYYYSLFERGYTIGMALTRKQGSVGFGIMDRAAAVIAGSSALSELSAETEPAGGLTFTAIGGQPIDSNILSEAGTIKGLIRGYAYDVTALYGTAERKFRMVADTKLMFSNPNAVFSFGNVKHTNQGCVALELDENTPEGFYMIEPNDALSVEGGMFYYNPNLE